MSENKEQVIIIGAGPAGLTAGCELLRNSTHYQVTILEATPFLGGISRTVNTGENRMDLGGHRFFSRDPRVMDWWTQLLPLQGRPSYDDRLLKRSCQTIPGGPDPDLEDLVFLKRRRISRIYYKGHFFDYPVRLNLSTLKNLGFFTALSAGVSYLKALLCKRPEKSLEDFYINRFGQKLYSIFFEGYTQKLWGRHPSQISPDWGAQRVKGLSVLALLKDILGKVFHKKNRHVETSLIESFYYPKYGPGQLWEEAARQFSLLGGQLLTQCTVTNIQQKNGQIISVSYKNGEDIHTLPADHLFSSMPLKDLVASMETVPSNIKSIAAGLPYRDFVTVGLLVNGLRLKNQTNIPTLGQIVPDCWIYVQDKQVKMGRIQLFNNWSPYLVKDPENTVWLGLEYFCREGDSMWNQTPDQWAELGKKELIQMKILEEDTQILFSHCEKVPKAYPAYFDTFRDIDKLQSWLNTIPNLYCIGRNGQHHYNNMDHSMLTAFEAVSLLLSGNPDHTSLWNINTENEYHEEKKEVAS